MDICVIGLGEVGRYISSVLVAEGNNVIVVDRNKAALNAVELGLDVSALAGNGATLHMLEKMRAASADLIIAASSEDESNMLACIFAKNLGTRKVVARVSKPEHLQNDQGVIYNSHGIDLIVSPEMLTATEITKHVRSIGALMLEHFADNRIELVQFAILEENKLIKHPISEISERYLSGIGVGIAAIVREGELLIPTGEDVLQELDEVFLIGSGDTIGSVGHHFGKKSRSSIQRVMIIGGGDIGLAVAKSLENLGFNVVVVERDSNRASELSVQLEKTAVIVGDGTNLSLLEEEGAGSKDVFISLSPDDETNLMAGLLAKRLGCSKVVALVHRPDYGPIYEQLGIDAAISPRLLAANQILKSVREGEVVSTSSLADGKGIIIELNAAEDSPIVNRPLSSTDFPRGAMVGAIAGEKGVFVPRGASVIRPGNTAIVFTTKEMRGRVEKMFSGKR
ncbi:MAG: Trk system potassium transporter TrkA [Candidatus Latescibacterota bacterium]|nr:Trk system potassium transporter TrkA [Candidatus Latescibacterota bacterium]